jgi:hypothetical protein
VQFNALLSSFGPKKMLVDAPDTDSNPMTLRATIVYLQLRILNNANSPINDLDTLKTQVEEDDTVLTMD